MSGGVRLPFRNHLPVVAPDAFVAANATLIGQVEIGARANIWFGCVLRGDLAAIHVGALTNVQDGTVIHVTNGTHATILEDEVTVGHNVTLHGCHVERGCVVGIGSIVMDGCRVGERSLIAAGALLSPGTVIPPRSLVMGFPARIKRQLTDEEVADLEVFWKNYVEYTRAYREEYGIAEAEV